MMDPKNEPVLWAGAVEAVILAGVAWAVSMGWIDWSNDQTGAFQAFITAAIVVVSPIVVNYVARGRVDGPKTAAAKADRIAELEQAS